MSHVVPRNYFVRVSNPAPRGPTSCRVQLLSQKMNGKKKQLLEPRQLKRVGTVISRDKFCKDNFLTKASQYVNNINQYELIVDF